ncbi:macro domain-containing protein [Candidatus Dependentiae bacterium]|nr:macro domain-containing protein [Candidatus Dependentiae bacterium]
MKNKYIAYCMLSTTCITGITTLSSNPTKGVVPNKLALHTGTHSSSLLAVTNPVTKRSTTITIIQGDILTQKVDAVVNAANEQLRGGGGVCGALFKAAGWDDLQAGCNKFAKNAQGIRCATGDAVITPSYALKQQGIRCIIHAVGPDCRIIRKSDDQKRLLASAYTRSLEEATASSCKSIAFPFISSAIFACPPDLAATTALEAIRDFILKNPNNSLENIVMVLFSKESYNLFIDKKNSLFSA